MAVYLFEKLIGIHGKRVRNFHPTESRSGNLYRGDDGRSLRTFRQRDPAQLWPPRFAFDSDGIPYRNSSRFVGRNRVRTERAMPAYIHLEKPRRSHADYDRLVELAAL